MKNIAYTLIALLIGDSLAAKTNDFIDQSNIQTIEIFFEQSNWDTVLEQQAKTNNSDNTMTHVLIGAVLVGMYFFIPNKPKEVNNKI